MHLLSILRCIRPLRSAGYNKHTRSLRHDTTPPHSHGSSNGESVGVNVVYNIETETRPNQMHSSSVAAEQVMTSQPGDPSSIPKFCRRVCQYFANFLQILVVTNKKTRPFEAFRTKTPPQGRHGPCWIAELKSLPRRSLNIFVGELKYFLGGA